MSITANGIAKVRSMASNRERTTQEDKILASWVSSLLQHIDVMRYAMEEPIRYYPNDKPNRDDFDDVDAYHIENQYWLEAEIARKFLAQLDRGEATTESKNEIPF